MRRQIDNHGYRLICIEDAGTVRAAAGYRVAEYLAWGRTFYVDDLITGEADRGRGGLFLVKPGNLLFLRLQGKILPILFYLMSHK